MSIQRSMVSEYVWRAVLSRAARAQRGAAQAPQQRCLALSDALHVVSWEGSEASSALAGAYVPAVVTFLQDVHRVALVQL